MVANNGRGRFVQRQMPAVENEIVGCSGQHGGQIKIVGPLFTAAGCVYELAVVVEEVKRDAGDGRFTAITGAILIAVVPDLAGYLSHAVVTKVVVRGRVEGSHSDGEDAALAEGVLV